jgi:hypothetical protein
MRVLCDVGDCHGGEWCVGGPRSLQAIRQVMEGISVMHANVFRHGRSWMEVANDLMRSLLVACNSAHVTSYMFKECVAKCAPPWPFSKEWVWTRISCTWVPRILALPFLFKTNWCFKKHTNFSSRYCMISQKLMWNKYQLRSSMLDHTNKYCLLLPLYGNISFLKIWAQL